MLEKISENNSEDFIIDTEANKPSGLSSTNDPFNPPQLSGNNDAENRKRSAKKEIKK